MGTKRHGTLPWLAELDVLRAQRGAGRGGRLLLDGLRLVEAAHAVRLDEPPRAQDMSRSSSQAAMFDSFVRPAAF